MFQNVVTVPCGGDKDTQGSDTWCHRGKVLPGFPWAQLGARAELRQVGREDWKWGLQILRVAQAWDAAPGTVQAASPRDAE